MSERKGKDAVGSICKGLQTESIGGCDMNRVSGLKWRRCGDSAKDQTVKEFYFIRQFEQAETLVLVSGKKGYIAQLHKGEK